MAIQFILGDICQDKKRKIIEKIHQLSIQHPQSKFYYIVPEHLKFDMEDFMMSTISDITQNSSASLFNIQVLSFKRLMWYLLPNTLKKHHHLSDIGVKMLIRQVLREETQHLSVYLGQVNYQGFVDKLFEQFSELIEGNITPANFLEIIQESQSNTDLTSNVEQMKLTELAYLYDKFISKLKGLQVGNLQEIERLDQFLSQTDAFKDDYIIIDHQYYFKSNQLNLIMTMVGRFKEVWVSLPLSHFEAKNQQWLPLLELPKQTYYQLHDLANYYQYPILPDWDISQFLFNYHPEIKHFLGHLRAHLNQSTSNLPKVSTEYLQVWVNNSIQTELLHISNQIYYLVHKKGYRYKDILIMGRDISEYEAIIKHYFELNRIPYFFDNKQEMENHPFVHWLNSFYNLNLYHWRIHDLMNVLKSRYIKPEYIDNWHEYYHRLALMENIMLENGYEGYRFYQLTYEWKYVQAETLYSDYQGRTSQMPLDQVIQELRRWICQQFVPIFQAYKEKDFTGQEASQWAYQSLDQLGMIRTLHQNRDQMIEAGDIDESKRIEQVWKVFVNTLNEFQMISQQERVSFKEFAEIVLTGLRTAQFHIIPPTLDQVTFTSIESPQVQPHKILFLVNVDNIHLPKFAVNDSLLSNENRQMITQNLLAHQSLSHHSNVNNLYEVFVAYQAMTNATEFIYLSYLSHQDNGDSLNLSPYYQPMMSDLKIKHYHFNQKHNVQLEHPSDIGSLLTFVSPVIQTIRHEKKILSSLPLIHLYRKYAQSLNLPMINDLILQTFKPFKLPNRIDPEIAQDLFGRNLIVSVSSIENYYKDPFAHFLIQGLKIRERKQFEILPTTSGSYFHEFLDLFMKYSIDHQIDLAKLSDNEFKEIIEKIKRELNQLTSYMIFNNHPRYMIQKDQLDFTIVRYLNLVRQQMKQTQLKPKFTELVFGHQHADLKQVPKYLLQSGGYLTLTGKIDRLDFDDQQQYFQVIDYKSGKKDFNLSDIYYGHELQLLTYLSMVEYNLKQSEPIGAFYHSITQSFEDGLENDWQSSQTQAIELKKHKFKGFVTIDSNSLQALQPNFDQIYPLSIKKDGNYDFRTTYFNNKQLEILKHYIEFLYVQAGNEIQSGNIQLAPYYEDKYATSIQPLYRVISGFDATEHYQNYRFKNLDKKDLFDAIQNQLNEGESLA